MMAEGVSEQRRVALVTNMCPHYRTPLFDELSIRFDLECYFFAETEPYWNPLLPSLNPGRFRRVELRRVDVVGEPLLPTIFSRLSRRRFDAMVLDLSGRLMVPYCFAASRVHRLPVVLWTGLWHHPHTPFHRTTKPLTEAIYRSADSILVYGEHVRHALTDIRGVDDGKIFTAAQSVDGRRFSIANDPSRSREVVFVGRFEEEKGLRYLRAAFEQLAHENVRLTLVGNGALEPELREWAEVDPRVTIIGHVSQDRLPEVLGKARMLVLPSITTATFREPWGLVVNEAMHAGMPVVATDAVGAAAGGLVVDGVTGRVVPEKDAASLAGALASLIEDDHLVRQLGRSARARVALHTFEAMADAFEQAVEHAVTKRR